MNGANSLSRYHGWALAAVLVGVAALTAVFIMLIARASMDDPVAAFGAFATPIVSLVTAFFGIQGAVKVADSAGSRSSDDIAALTEALASVNGPGAGPSAPSPTGATVTS